MAAPSLGRSATDLVLHSCSGDELSPRQEGNLVAAVKAGTGFAGWHGGVIGTNVRNADYLRMVGGRSLWHREGFQEFTVRIVAIPDRDGVITKGIEDYDVVTEHDWVLTDAHNSVLAASVLVPETIDAWDVPVEFPVVWTRRWGVGRVFVCTLGHRFADLEVPQTATMVGRGSRGRRVHEVRAVDGRTHAQHGVAGRHLVLGPFGRLLMRYGGPRLA
ncbi:ThuA domain-containing protein [Streptomyces tendae]|uniref:ThuA domain-containing protein n=1 Tax=Streptomyces tendae TaxID=1932 RepID=UPI0033BD1CB3